MKVIFEGELAPTQAYGEAAAWDLYLPEDTYLETGLNKVDLKIKFQIPPNYCCNLSLTKSGLAGKDLSVEAGLIDSDYRGPIILMIRNHGIQIFIKAKTKIAQAKFEIVPPVEMIKGLVNLTERGEKGFGSSNVCHTNIH